MKDLPVIREGTIIYSDVKYGDGFVTGHNVVIRGPTKIGNDVLIGTGTIIEGDCEIGDCTRIQSGGFIPKKVKIGNCVFVGPCVVFTNDKYPPGELSETVVGNWAVIGANATILPGIIIGEHAFIAAGALVTKNVPDFKMAIGCPAKIRDKPREMQP